MILADTTGVAALDQALCAVIALIEQRCPGRVRGYYLVGSYAVGEAQPGSDLDLLVLFKGALLPDEPQQFAAVRAACRPLVARTLDLTQANEEHLFRVGGVWFQTASRLLYGEDVRASVPRKPVAQHTHDLLHAVYPLLARVRGDPSALIYPLGYPDPAAEFYGYDRRQVPTADGLRGVGTKDLVTNVLAIASALTLLHAGQYVGAGKKSDIPHQYRLVIGDEWSELVEGCYADCRIRWGYALPALPAERQRLRALGAYTLAFENHFLRCYRAELHAAIEHPDAAIRRFATQRLAQIIAR